MKTINVSFENTEFETVEKAKRGQSWRNFILERAAIDSSNEMHSKGINADALRGLCLEYDLTYGPCNDNFFEGFALLHFFLESTTNVIIPGGKEEIAIWEMRIAELKKIKEKKEK